MKSGLRLFLPLALIAAACAFSCSMRETLKPANDLPAGELKGMIDAKSGLVLVDTRTEYEYRQGRLPGAINIPPYRFKELARLLPPDKDAKIVFYCRGGG